MKKSLLCLALAAMAMLGTTAFAESKATYNDGTVTSDAQNVKTVLITDNKNDVWYVNQAEAGSALNAATGFAMKTGAPAGTYTLALGYTDVDETAKTVDKISFEITDKLPDVQVNALTGEGAVVDNGNGTHNAAFKADAVVLTGYNSLVFGFNEENKDTVYMAYPLSKLEVPKISGGGAITIAIQLNNVPDKYKNNVTLYFSTYEVAGSGGTGE